MSSRLWSRCSLRAGSTPTSTPCRVPSTDCPRCASSRDTSSTKSRRCDCMRCLHAHVATKPGIGVTGTAIGSGRPRWASKAISPRPRRWRSDLGYRLGVPDGFTEKFAAGLASYGDQPCIEFEGRWYSGDDITGYADAIATVLRAAGVAEGAPVGLVVRNRLP